VDAADVAGHEVKTKEKPRSWLNFGGSGSGKRWMLLTQQATKVKTKEKPRAGLNPGGRSYRKKWL